MRASRGGGDDWRANGRRPRQVRRRVRAARARAAAGERRGRASPRPVQPAGARASPARRSARRAPMPCRREPPALPRGAQNTLGQRRGVRAGTCVATGLRSSLGSAPRSGTAPRAHVSLDLPQVRIILLTTTCAATRPSWNVVWIRASTSVTCRGFPERTARARPSRSSTRNLREVIAMLLDDGEPVLAGEYVGTQVIVVA